MVKGDDLALLLDNLLGLLSDVQSTSAYTLQLIAYAIASFVDPTGTAGSKLSSMLKQMPTEVINLATQELNLAFHEINYSELNPFAYYNFRSKHNNVN